MSVSRTRSRLFEIQSTLRKAGTQEAYIIIEMIGILVEEYRNTLVSADGNDMLRAQGAARAFEKLHRELTTLPPTEDR